MVGNTRHRPIPADGMWAKGGGATNLGINPVPKSHQVHRLCDRLLT